MTSRRSPRRPISPVLVALLVGASTAGAATVLSASTDAVAGEQAGQGASFTVAERSPAPVGQAAPRHSLPSGEASTSVSQPATTTSQPTTSQAPPPSSTEVPLPPPASVPPAEQFDPQQQAQRVVALVNQARAESGCAPLQVDERLVAAALGHATDMATRNYFSHETPEGVKFNERIISAGYPAPAAENLAQGQNSAQKVMSQWMESPGHRANIVNCQLATIGVAVAKGTDIFWAQEFGYPLA